jgi:hypothetical protein
MNGWTLDDTYLTQIVDVDDFWSLYDELCQDKRRLRVGRPPVLSLEWRERMLRAHKLGHLYGLRVNETDALYQRGARRDAIFARGSLNEFSFYLLPCFCLIEEGEHSVMWTHKRARRMGLELRLLDFLRQKYTLSEETSHSLSCHNVGAGHGRCAPEF